MLTVHPHACGEHKIRGGSTQRNLGSSPRMWGTPVDRSVVRAVCRFIPTHVGNTAGRYSGEANLAVHPHACGEHIWTVPVKPESIGSSPRMWGTLVVNTLIKICPRFIPTHVGNTGPSPYFPSPNSVHPHACGEHTPLVALAVEICPVHPHACGEHSYSSELIGGSAGSSPRMWGTPNSSACHTDSSRFIPTHVGNT